MDDLTEQQRHRSMAHNRSCDTKPEVIVRQYLFSKGLRFRKNDKRYPGKPDIVLPKYKTVVFVNGCFWHQHPNCRYASIPQTNVEYWRPKLNRNVERDKEHYMILEDMGWRVFVVWECQLKPTNRETVLQDLFKEITNSNI